MDPTHFSAVRHHYQQTAEFLLDGRALVTFPEINKKDLEAFRDTYGASAYVCRYLHCFFSTNGFKSSSQRATHESKHQRRFRCAHSSCVYFTTGFVTRNLLNRHNERYHPAIAEGPRLADSITPPAVPSVVQEPEGSPTSSLVSRLSVQPQPGFPQQQLPPNQQQQQQQDILPPTPTQFMQQQALQQRWQQQQQQQQQGILPPTHTQLMQQQALQQQVVQQRRQQQQQQQQQGILPPNPTIANLILPSAMNGSPHLMQNTRTPSPAQSGPKLKQSPRVGGNKRVKDDGGGEVNGTGRGAGPKLKQNPRVGGNKRVKASR